jgi:hypothetical protein
MVSAICCDFCGRRKYDTPIEMLGTFIFINRWRKVGYKEDMCPECYNLLKRIGKQNREGKLPIVEVVDEVRE